ncbi:F0F1 ATP synthase subunit B [Anaerosphaera multitolerans]|uniref:ATP synthase subunit b n=1 Tax=Anaerosphaera multitolerans TaxID=2487351 RepID=A0A437S634_9FIRM|nr:F0F1 ATP synthase subunit B [Anaerosphaera multitolerans]RVU54366.1 ATP synthase F0 subunit B [Anaerosphaera multitolerans]
MKVLSIMFSSVIMNASADLPDGNIISFDSELLKAILPQVINLIVLIFVLTFILYKPVRNFLDKRSETIKNRLDNARASQDEAEELKEKYEKLLKEIDSEREKVLSTAYKKAMERSDHILMEAKEEAENIYNHAIMEIEEERKNIEDDMKKQLIELSTLMASQFVEVSIDEKTQNQLIEEMLGDWEEGLWLN